MRAAAAALAVVALARTASADQCEDLVAATQASVERQAHRVSNWRWAWGIGGTVAIAGQLALIPIIDDHDATIDLLVGAGATVAIFFGVIFAPEVDRKPDPRAASCPERLVDATRRLDAAAASAREKRGPWMHVLNGAYNVGVGLLLGLGWDHWASGVANAVFGFGIGELQLLTIPVPVVPMVAKDAVGLSLVFRF